MPADALVSVVVPVHDSMPYLRECLDSLRAQTHAVLEVVCVDDGSTDESARVCDEYAEHDPRVRVIRQANAGPGAARNAGIDAATGDYLCFLDADDWFAENAVEAALARLDEAGAQLCVMPYYEFDVRSGTPILPPWGVLPDRYPDQPFCWRDNPDWIFEACKNLPWNKLARTDFVRANGLRFQEDVRLTEDLMFSAPALVCADAIVFAGEPLVYHRQGTGCNTMAAKDRRPFDFIEAFCALRTWLQDRGVYDELRVAYINWCLDGCVYNLHTLNTPEGFRQVFVALAGEAGKRLGLSDAAPGDVRAPGSRELARVLAGGPDACDAYLYRLYVDRREDASLFLYYDHVNQIRIAREKGRVAERDERLAALQQAEGQLRRDLDAARAERDGLANCREMRVGRTLLAPARAVQRQLRKRRPDA